MNNVVFCLILTKELNLESYSISYNVHVVVVQDTLPTCHSIRQLASNPAAQFDCVAVARYVSLENTIESPHFQN